MPHITIKMLKGRTDEQKKLAADKVAAALVDAIGCNADHISVAVEDFTPVEWQDEFRKEVTESQHIYKEPHYDPKERNPCRRRCLRRKRHNTWHEKRQLRFLRSIPKTWCSARILRYFSEIRFWENRAHRNAPQKCCVCCPEKRTVLSLVWHSQEAACSVPSSRKLR